MHELEPYPPELSGLLKKIKKAFKKAGKKISKAFKPVRRAFKDIGHGVRRAFTVPHKVRKAWTEGHDPMDVLTTWIDTELEPGIEKFAEGRTFITPVDVALAPLTLVTGGASSAVLKGAQVGTKAAGAVGWKAAAWAAVKVAAKEAVPEVFSAAIAEGMSYSDARDEAAKMEKLAERAEEREAAEIQKVTAQEIAIARLSTQYAIEAAGPEGLIGPVEYSETKPFPWAVIAAGVGLALILKQAKG